MKDSVENAEIDGDMCLAWCEGDNNGDNDTEDVVNPVFYVIYPV